MAPTHTTLAPSTHPRTRPTAIVCPHPWSVSPLPMVSVHPLPPISVSSLPQVPLSPYPRSVSPWTLVSVFPLPTVSMPPHPRSLCPQDPLPIMNTFSQACRQEWWGADRPLTPVSGGLWTCLQPALWMGHCVPSHSSGGHEENAAALLACIPRTALQAVLSYGSPSPSSLLLSLSTF